MSVAALTFGLGACGNADESASNEVSRTNTSSSSASSATTPSSSSAKPSSSSSSTSPSATKTNKPPKVAAPSVSSAQRQQDANTPASASSAATSSTTTSKPWSTSTPVKTVPGATRSLRFSCVNVNNQLFNTNQTWNRAASSGSAKDIDAARQDMRKLAQTARQDAESAGNADFKSKSLKLAQEADGLADKTSGVLDASGYNTASQAVTTYCTGMFPKA